MTPTPHNRRKPQPFWNRPCAQAPLLSYRYPGPYGWIMIGAYDTAEALSEASRSTSVKIRPEALEQWNDTIREYQRV